MASGREPRELGNIPLRSDLSSNQSERKQRVFTDRKKLFRTALLGSTATFAGGAVLGASGVAVAQDQDQEAAETILVTGSRIPRQDLIANSPVAVVGAEEFALTGNVQVENLLNDLPQIVPGLTTVNNNPGGIGSTVDLRGIGINRTLVLVNGKRWIPSALAGFTDVQTIPSGMVERVEVVTGGASAVYGSDAIGGVINFILKDDFEGLAANAQYDIHSKGDGERIYIDATMGSNFADGRGNVMINVSWFKQNPIFQGDREFSEVPCMSAELGGFFVGGVNGGTFGTSAVSTAPFTGENAGICGVFEEGGAASDKIMLGSSTLPVGVIQGAAGPTLGSSLIFDETGQFFSNNADPDICPTTDLQGISGFGSCNYNYAPPNYLQLPVTRTTINLQGHYDINDDITFFMNASFVNIDIAQRLAPTPGVTTVNFHTSNPFLLGREHISTGVELINQLANAACSRFGAGLDTPTFTKDADTNTSIQPETCGVWHQNANFFTTGGATATGPGTGITTTFTTTFTRLTGTAARNWIRNNNNGNMPFRIQRRMIEVGAREGPINDDLYQFTVGFRGDFANGWTWETYYQYAKFFRSNGVFGDIDPTRLKQAVDARRDPVLDVNGNQVVVNGIPQWEANTTSCNIPIQQGPSPTAKNNPCVPMHFFGLNSITPAQASWIALDAQQETEFEREMFGFNLAGNLVELPAGPLGFAVGVEARRESGRFSPDDAFANGLLGFNAAQPTAGRINVWEAYGEFLAPLITDAPLAEYLAVEGGVRWSKYSTIGTIWTWKLGGEWRPFEDLKIRGLFQKAVRAPNISELFAGVAQGFPGYTDPCNGINGATGTTASALACNVWFNAAGAGVAGLSNSFFVQNNSQVESAFLSNPNLGEETANTWTVGGVFTPHQIPNLELIVDYYSITLKGGVGLQFGGTRSLIADCFAALLANPTQSTFNSTTQCQRAPRSATTGQISVVTNVIANLSLITAKGLDIQVRYNFDLEDAIGVPGTINFQGLYTHVFEQGVASLPGSPISDCAGFFACGGATGFGSVPDNKVAARATYRNGAYAVSLRWTMVGGMDNASGTFYGIGSIGAEHVLDVTFQWDINDTVTLTLGVENVTNAKPPFLGIFGVESNTDPSTFQAQLLGPRFFGRVSANF